MKIVQKMAAAVYSLNRQGCRRFDLQTIGILKITFSYKITQSNYNKYVYMKI